MNKRDKYLYTQEQINYLKEIIKGRILPQISKLYKEKYGREITQNELFAFRKKYKVKSGINSIKGRYKYNYNDDEIEFLKKMIKTKYKNDIIKLYKEKFGKEITEIQLKLFKRRYNIKCNFDGRFQKGKVNNPKPPKQIGTERIYYDNGKKRIMVKIGNKKWIEKTRYVYEKYYGEIPKNSVIIFLDGNRDNFDIKNLKCITHKEHEIMAGNCLYFKDKELNETSVIIAKLISKIKEAK